MGQISLQFSSQKGWMSDLIEYKGSGLYSHVDAILKDGQLLGARLDGGVKIRPSSYATFDHVLRVDIPCTDEQEEKFYELLSQEVGKPYDKEAIAGVILGRNWHDDSAWFCSELIADKLEKTAIFPYPLTTSTYKIEPDPLLLALSARYPITIPPEV